MLVSVAIRTIIVAFGLVSALFIERYYKDLFEVENNPLEWNLFSYGIMIAFIFNISLILAVQNNIRLGKFLEIALYMIPTIGSFLVMLGTLKLWREFKLE